MTFEKRLEDTVFKLFMGRHSKSRFIADIAGSVNINVVEQDPDDESVLAYTDGSAVFMGRNLNNHNDEDIEFVLLHELYHVGLMHTTRRGDRDHDTWNRACDYIINNALVDDGYKTTIEGLFNPAYKDHSEESLYEKLMKENPPGSAPPPGGGGQGNQQGQGGGSNSPGQGSGGTGGQGGQGKPTLKPQDVPQSMSGREQSKVQAVVQNAIAASGEKDVGNMFGNLQQMFDTMEVKEKDWRTVLYDFMEQAFGEWDIDYNKPNRRFEEFFIPAWTDETENIKTLNCYIDTSGSVSDESVQRYISEIAYLKSLFNPDAVTISCFDTQIGKTVTYTADEDIEKFNIVGRGGTHLECVRKHIEETQPVVAVVFSDLYCSPMTKPKHDCGVLWIQYDDEDNMSSHEPIVGTKVHFDSAF